MLSNWDFTFIDKSRPLEVDAVNGGRSSLEYSLDPIQDVQLEETPFFGHSVDTVEKMDDIAGVLPTYEAYAQRAFRQRGLDYPFFVSDSRTSLEVLSGKKGIAARVAEISAMEGVGSKIAKKFEMMALKAAQKIFGGEAICVGDPREMKPGLRVAIESFRERLMDWERGDFFRREYSPRGDLGADGFLFLARFCHGPVFFYQAKNARFNLKKIPEEFQRAGQVLQDWFGKDILHERLVIPIFAVNTVLTLDIKSDIVRAMPSPGIFILDAVDILFSEFGNEPGNTGQGSCLFL